ncbi:transcriptional regulator KorA [Asaia spathodeae]|uniref:TrfB transcriptional repressor protein domain-containing protein n=1 Tax=Asaia spathodeae TaxID=657016 RepID=A0ABX2P8A9_9PROT|nr:transcriptional regulator KorA [Asaia spathodeae]GBR16901.1 hypothetical protein AA105894_1687 [Asaia spathodeae NBRC 105894]
MTPKEFDSAVKFLSKLDSTSIEIGRLVLVQGQSQKEVAASFGLTKQRVSAIIRRLEQASASVPNGWVKVTVWLPPDAARKVEEIEKEEKNKISL